MNNKLKAILTGGLVGGAFDIAYATGFSWFRSQVPPMRIFQSVASGLLGKSAFDGGTTVAALGLGLHFAMALVIASIYVVASRSISVLTRRPIFYGAIYGLVVYSVMNAIVVPLSNVPARTAPRPTILIVSELLVHMIGVGVPIALAARKFVK
jgi:uncharacterized membrane protein YagU involved in acid resistance